MYISALTEGLDRRRSKGIAKNEHVSEAYFHHHSILTHYVVKRSKERSQDHREEIVNYLCLREGLRVEFQLLFKNSIRKC